MNWSNHTTDKIVISNKFPSSVMRMMLQNNEAGQRIHLNLNLEIKKLEYYWIYFSIYYNNMCECNFFFENFYNV